MVEIAEDIFSELIKTNGNVVIFLRQALEYKVSIMLEESNNGFIE